MNKITKMAAWMGLALNCACSVSTNDIPIPAAPGGGETFGVPYETAPLSGSVFGKDWVGRTAVLRPSQGDLQMNVLEIYGEERPNACSDKPSNQSPSVSIIIDKNLELQEYVVDLSQSSGTVNPLVFTTSYPQTKNLIADKTKIKIESIDDKGLSALIYAKGLDEAGQISEINGRISVKDCSKVVDFSTWSQMVGSYELVSFDGVAVKNSMLSWVEDDNSNFRDIASGRLLKAIVFPLYFRVGEFSSGSYTFGPIKELGVTSIEQKNGSKIYRYHVDSPVKYEGEEIRLRLDLEAVSTGKEIDITYTLEIPNEVPKTSHKFVIRK